MPGDSRARATFELTLVFLFLILDVILLTSCGGGSALPSPGPQNNPKPAINSLSPSTALAGVGGTTVTVAGTGFIRTSTAQWNGSNRPTTFVSSAQLQVALSAADLAAAGSGQITVVNPAPGGGTSSAASFAINNPAPQISAISPTSATTLDSGSTVTITGTGFIATSAVTWNGAAHIATYVSATELQLTLQVSDVAAVGTAQIAVVNPAPGGGTSAAIQLAITTPVPTLTSVSPASIFVNSPDTLVTIQGSGFIAGVTVQVNGTDLTPTTFDPAHIYCTFPASTFTSTGTLSVTATDPGGAASNALTITVAPNPVPILYNISPNSSALGGAGVTVTVFGSNFTPTSTTELNGSPLPTTFESGTQLTAEIPTTDLESLGNASVTVFNPAPGGGLSSALLFTTYLGIPANDLVYSPSTQLLYASVASTAGPTLGNSIVPIDPNTGVLGAPIFVGSEPAKMALSSDGNTIWVSLEGAGAVREVNLTTHTAGMQFTLGGGTGIYNPPVKASALAVLPGLPNTLAVAVPTPFTYSSVVTVYDSGVARTNAQNGNLPCCSGIAGLSFDSTGTKLYEAGSGYELATVDNTGITAVNQLNTGVSSTDLRVDNGRAYLTSGDILDANLGTQLGVFSCAPSQNATGVVAPDSTLGEAFVLLNGCSIQAYQIDAFDLSTFNSKGSISAAAANTSVQPRYSLTRWGQDGLAFGTGSQVYVLRSPVVRDLSTSLANLNAAASAPASGTTGTNLTFSLTVGNAGPVGATPATLLDNIPNGSTFQSVTASQGSCSGGAVVSCDLGNLASGNSATVQITVTPLLPGTLTNTVTVSAPQGDPNLADNSATSTTAVTGAVYNPSPALTSISPAFVQAGSASFSLAVNGSGFTPNSVVQFNSTALPTTFVSDSELTATVDGSDVATMGWGWINVTNPVPGGGTSSNLPLTTYQVISLDANRLTFDPFTQKLYATIPSTATQVAGNSLVAIDPLSGSLSTPLNVGSEPNRMAETSDGNYLYIGLDGSKSLTRVDLTSMTQGAVYPLTIGSTTQIAARDLAVAPNNDNLLAIDTGSFNGIGLFDISGSTGTFRTNLTGPYTGSNLTFANGTTLYSYDSDTSGAEFNIWTVTSTGLTLNNNTGYTLNGIGGFSGSYQLANGLVYGFGGGVADPSTAPPTQLGQFAVDSAMGSGQSVEGTGIAPAPSFGRVFILGETLAGSANPVLLSYDSNTYTQVSAQQFTGFPQGQDLTRWGRDGLAWHTSLGGAFGSSTAGSGKIFLMRGPFVLPEWSAANPTPGLVSASPASAAAGSGNFTLTVTGSGFVPGAVLKWNGAERTTTFVDASHLTVAIPKADLTQAGTATLVVNNPGSSDSSSISFTVN
ncbi:MAG TPA: IPT/TIG domain-containing protein [Terriglobia bacterium]|nr:IPT/TIG domain-containing protein [Terriglobia bacterium]